MYIISEKNYAIKYMEQLLQSSAHGLMKITSGGDFTIRNANPAAFYLIDNAEDPSEITTIRFDASVDPDRIFVITAITETFVYFPYPVNYSGSNVTFMRLSEFSRMLCTMKSVLGETNIGSGFGVLATIVGATLTADRVITGMTAYNSNQSRVESPTFEPSISNCTYIKLATRYLLPTLIKATAMISAETLTSSSLTRITINAYPNQSDLPSGTLVPSMTSNTYMWPQQGLQFVSEASSGTASAWNAFDNNFSTAWTATTGNNVTLSITMPVAIVADEVVLSGLPSAPNTWTSWSIYGSNTSPTTYTDLLMSSNQPLTDTTSFKFYNGIPGNPQRTAYKYYIFRGNNSVLPSSPNGLRTFALVASYSPSVVYNVDAAVATGGVNRWAEYIVSTKVGGYVYFSLKAMSGNNGATNVKIKWFMKTVV